VSGVTTPVLVVHGTKDRSGPYGGGRDWAAMLPNARLVTVPKGSGVVPIAHLRAPADGLREHGCGNPI